VFDPIVFTICGLTVGMYMAWTIGANDVANAMGTSVGSKVLTLRQAILVAAVFEFAGAFFAGGAVTNTIRYNVIQVEMVERIGHTIGVGMLAALLASAVWLHLATWRGWPVSTTHAIIGAVAGFGFAAAGLGAVRWGTLVQIGTSWVLSPILGGVMAWLMFTAVRKIVFSTEHPLARARVVTPILVGVVGAVLTLSMIYKGLKNLHLDLPLGEALALAGSIGILTGLAGWLFLVRWSGQPDATTWEAETAAVERQFRSLQVITACYVAFAHGSNDAANAVGPMAAMLTSSGNDLLRHFGDPATVLMALGGIGIVVGLATYGYKVIYTIGSKITEVTPSRGFVMEFSTASVVLLGSKLGLPVSTTHVIIGAVVGVGMARGMSALNTRMIGQIVSSWIVTLPAAGVLAALFYVGLQPIFP
jgi:PiT family inorganic phosphate transporter